MAEYSLFSGVPSVADGSDPDAVSLGTEFYVTETCWAVGLRGLQPNTNGDWTTAKQMALYSTTDGDTGTLVWGPFTVPIDDQVFWQTVRPETPFQLEPGTRYRVAVFHPTGRYAVTSNYFTTGAGSTDTVVGPLVMPNTANAYGQTQGSYAYGGAIAFPGGTFNGGNYYSDVIVTDVPPEGLPASASVALSGAGTLSATGSPNLAVIGALSGAGDLTGGGSTNPEILVQFAGEGILSSAVTGLHVSTDAALSGAGTLSAVVAPNLAADATLSGSGTLGAVALRTMSEDIAFDSVGDLTFGLVANLSTTAELAGDGLLEGIPGDRPTADFIGFSTGTLSAVVRPALAVAAGFGGLGSLTFQLELSGRDVLITAYLADNQRRQATLPDNRWEAHL